MSRLLAESAQKARRKALPKKSIQSGTSWLVLGTRAPSPAMSAKRENSYSVQELEIERAAHASAGEGARAHSTSLSVPAIPLFGQGRGRILVRLENVVVNTRFSSANGNRGGASNPELSLRIS